MNIASSFRMKEIDRISIEERGFGGLLLMENAGIRILEAAVKAVDFNPHDSVLCIAGSGNNGGDALVIARQIFSRMQNPVNILILKEKGSAAFDFNLNICRNLGIKISVMSKVPAQKLETLVKEAGVIFDGIAGTGIDGSLRESAAGLTKLINKAFGCRIAIDLPSGTGEKFRKDYPAVKADYTFTVGLPKRALFLPSARPYCGKITTISIGFPEDLLNAEGGDPDGRIWKLIDDAAVNRLSPELLPGDYKNTRGHLAVFAGSPGTTGAASLCAEAAIRTSAGLVSLFADNDTYAVLAAKHRAVMVKPLQDKPPQDFDAANYGAAAVGPGWGTEGRGALLDAVLSAGRGVLDADAITILAAEREEKGSCRKLGGRWILTPHPGEFRRLFPDLDPINNPYESVVEAAERVNCIILLKGITTFIASADRRCALLDGNFPALGTAGSGDLLCGIIAGYAASGMDLFDAAILGAAVHLKAGKACGAENRWFSADMLLDYIGRRG